MISGIGGRKRVGRACRDVWNWRGGNEWQDLQRYQELAGEKRMGGLAVTSGIGGLHGVIGLPITSLRDGCGGVMGLAVLYRRGGCVGGVRVVVFSLRGSGARVIGLAVL